jgi:putative ABC transport system permease protein
MAVFFVVACIILGAAYYLLNQVGFYLFESPEFIAATALMLVGTLLFFYSLAGFVTATLTHAPGVYLRGLVPFTTGQIASRINTAFVSLWAICVMLFFAITVFSCGFGLVKVFCGDIEAVAPYDATIRADRGVAKVSPLYTQYDGDMAAALEAGTQGWLDAVRESAQVDVFEVPGATYNDLFEQARLQDTSAAGAVGEISQLSLEDIGEQNVQVVAISQVNAALALSGGEQIELVGDTFAILNNLGYTQSMAEVLSGMQLDLADATLSPSGKVYAVQLLTTAMNGTGLIFAVPDSVVDSLKAAGELPKYSYLNLAYTTTDLVAGDAALDKVMSTFDGITVKDGAIFYHGDSTVWPVTYISLKSEMYSQAGGLRMLITYLAVYLSFVLLITTASILSIHQLTQASESAPRYAMLDKLGAGKAALGRSVFVTCLVYFLAPALLAALHSAVALNMLDVTFFGAIGIDVMSQCLVGAGVLLVFYAAYFVITFCISKKIALGAGIRAA